MKFLYSLLIVLFCLGGTISSLKAMESHSFEQIPYNELLLLVRKNLDQALLVSRILGLQNDLFETRMQFDQKKIQENQYFQESLALDQQLLNLAPQFKQCPEQLKKFIEPITIYFDALFQFTTKNGSNITLEQKKLFDAFFYSNYSKIHNECFLLLNQLKKIYHEHFQMLVFGYSDKSNTLATYQKELLKTFLLPIEESSENLISGNNEDTVTLEKEEKPKNICPYKGCSQAITNNNQEAHDAWHTCTRTFRCEECKFAFVKQYNLNQHMRTHTQKRKYSCSIPECGKTFTRQSDKTRHEKSHKPPQYTCNINKCGAGFYDKFEFNDHAKQNHNFHLQCLTCSEEFCSRAAISQHTKKEHTLNIKRQRTT